MDNSLKLLMSEADLDNLKKLSISIVTYQDTILKPFKDTLSGEARRAINLTRKIELALREGDKLLGQIKGILNEAI